MNVVKRDGRIVAFDKEKIKSAVLSAFKEVDGEETSYAKEKSAEIARFVATLDRDLTVEEIQDAVENKLMASNRKDVAKAYILFRNTRSRVRQDKSNLIKSVGEKLKASNVQNQNANVDEYSFGGRMGEATEAVTKEYALYNCMSKMARENHLNNEIYIHDLGSYAVGSHNCYLKSTKFITSDGIKSFEDYKDGDDVVVLTKDGTWREAIVHFYGRQPMYEITLSRCGISKTVVATRNHRWLLRDGTFTDNVQIGDYIYPLKQMEKIEIDNKRKAQMFAFGFILGDGYDHGEWTEVKFCTPEKENYIGVFENAGYSIGFNNNYKYARKKLSITKQEFLNNRLWRILSFEDKRCLFEGYLAADGSKTTNTKHIWTSDKRMCELINCISALDGYHIHRQKKINSDTNFKKNRELYEYVFTTHYRDNTTWKVVDIKKGKHNNKDYEAWCLEEPETHTFTLEGGIVTGNCLSIPFDDLLANGFKTRQTDVRPAQSVSTAFQLVAVIFQIQSLQQFGGVSATHLDWTMVPYVRKSFYKHYKTGLKYIIGDGSDVLFCLSHPEETSIEQNSWKETNGIKTYFNAVYENEKAYQYALDMTKKEVHQAVEGMYHNLNTLQSRSGNQLPFTSINYGTCTLTEGRMITKAILDVSIEGIGKLKKTPIFPCGIFQCMKEINRKPGEPNYDLYKLALKSTSRRLYPNYSNCDWSGNEGYDKNDPKTYFSTMGLV